MTANDVATGTLLPGLAFPESTRWHAGRLWFSNWGKKEILAVDLDGNSEVALSLPFDAFPFSFDWLPDGRMLISSLTDRPLIRRERDGSLVDHGDLHALGIYANEIVVDGRGNAYVNGSMGMPGPQGFPPGAIALVTPDGSTRQVAADIAFPNGMAVTPDNSTLIVAESFAKRLTAFDIAPDGSLSGRRVWADLGEDHPDGICLDAEGAVWYADVPHHHCVRVREGGEVLRTIDLDDGCFACMLGGPAGDTLFIATAEWRGFENMTGGPLSGRIRTAPAPAPGAGWPARS